MRSSGGNAQPDRLSARALALCDDPANRIILSVVSIWEIQIKLQLGKLKLQRPIAEIADRQQRENDLRILSVELNHVLALARLPLHHKDPFDRLLICQAREEGWPILSADHALGMYGVPVLW